MPAVNELPYLPAQSPWRRRAKGFLGALQASPDDVAVPFPAMSAPLPNAVVGDGGGAPAATSVVGGVDYRQVGLPAIQDWWQRTNPGQDWKALARAYWDSHPELAAAGYSDWSPYKW